MGIVVDTNIFIDAENGRLDLKKLHLIANDNTVYIAAITVSELLAGVHLAGSSAIKLRRSAFVEGIIANVPVLSFDEKVARCYAELYAHFLQPRTKLASNVHDLQIAATCITYGYAVLTSNTDDFKKIPGLDIVKPEMALVTDK